MTRTVPTSRRPRRIVGLAALLLTGLVWGGPAVPQTGAEPLQSSDTAELERRQLLTRLERLREETAATEARAAELSEELVDISGDEARLRQRQAEVAARLAELERRIAADEEALEDLTDRQAGIRQELAEKREELATVLMALQRIGRRPPPALFGETGGATETVRGAILLNAVLPVLDAEARALGETLAEAARLAEEERARWVRLRQDLSAVAEERERLEDVAAEIERRRALSLYERDRAAAELARLAEEEGSVSALLERLSRGGTAVAPPAGENLEARRGTLALPVAGRIVARFGEATGAGDVTAGHTIAALPEATVFAPMNASVLFSSPFRGYGHVLILDAGGGYHMVLAGLETASVAPGDRVTTGAPLGRMGDAGMPSALAAAGEDGSSLIGTRPVLYVELRKDGAAVDSDGWWRETPVDVGRTSE